MYIIIALLIFGVIIMIHELGHFLFAKRAGITVHEFSIGMGPSVYKKEKNGTLYSVRILPIGGYVAMEGEDEESDDPNSFGKKSILDRFLTIFAGPFFNVILCILLLYVGYLITGVPSTKIDAVQKDSPAYVAGIRADDQIIAVDGEKITNYYQYTGEITHSGGKELKITVNRGGKEKTFEVTPQPTATDYIIGVVASTEKNPIRAIPASIHQTVKMTRQMLTFLGRMITGQYGGKIINSLAGPVGAINMVSQQAKVNGFTNTLIMAALLSLNIGIMNLLPIPALDGWRILMLIIEFVLRGKKIPSKVEGYLNGAGLILLLAFMAFITYKDILRIFFKN